MKFVGSFWSTKKTFKGVWPFEIFADVWDEDTLIWEP